MFKKMVEAKTLQRLSGADKKKLRRSVKEKFPLASDSDIDLILPQKAEITVAKYQNRVLVYAVEGGFPVFFDIDGRGTEIYPTVYALWKASHILPFFTLKGGEVSRFIIGGADLMFPGISIPLDGLPSFSAGELWSVKVPGNPAPFAVGATTMSTDQALKVGLRGKALRIVHYYHDSLWESFEGRFVPNAGFLKDVVYPDPSLPSTLVECCEIDPSNEHKNDADFALTCEPDVANDGQDLVESSSANTPNNDRSDTFEQLASRMGELQSALDYSVEESNVQVEDRHPLSASDVDGLLDKCLLQALHATVKDKDLPLPGSTLWSNHILPCRPSGVTLDMKKSSFKKLSKWLQFKASTGLLSVKEDKYKKEIVLLAVNRTHPDYLSFKPNKVQAEKIDQANDKVSGDSQPQRSLVVEEVYRPSSHVSPVFASLGFDTGGFFTALEATEIVFNYIEKENLVKSTDKSMVILDATLCDALYKGAIKKGSTYPTEVFKKDLGPTFLNRMQAHHKVIRGTDIVVKKGAAKTIQIMTERRQGNKKVTKVSGFDAFLMDAESLASELQKKFACSTTVVELPGKKGHEVLVQGGVIDHLGKHLVEQYGIPKRYIEVLDKTKK